MHTVETEHHASGPLAFLHKRRFMQSEDTRLAVIAAWTLGMVVFTLTGFYIGSIVGHENHPHDTKHKDLDPAQLQAALPYMYAGIAVGIIFALLITFWYTPVKLREIAHEEGGHH